MLFVINTVAFANENININVDGNNIEFDVLPFINAESRTMVPIRFVANELGAVVKWYDKERMVEIIREGINIKLFIDSKEIYVNDFVESMDTEAIIIDNRTMVPIRFIVENLQADISWEENTRTVVIESYGEIYDLKNDIIDKKLAIKIQEDLTRAGFYTIIDGYVGPNTLNSFIKFKEKDTSLINNYIYDSKMRRKIKEMIEEKKVINPNDILVIVNKKNNLDKDFIPEKLIKLDILSNREVYMRDEAAEAVTKMFLDAKKSNIQLMVVSGYRSYKTQEIIFNRSFRKTNSVEETNKYIAIPGESEHQTGLAVDILSKKHQSLTGFENTNAFIWLQNNAYKYGFVLRYLQNKTQLTGYSYEPWHYRYIGDVILAEKIKNKSIVLEEIFY